MHVVGGLGFQVGGHQGLNISRGQLHVVVAGGQRCAEVSVQRGQFLGIDTVNVEHVHNGGEEQLQFHLGQTVAETHALSGAERQKVLWLVDLAGVRLDEPLGPELFWLWPLNGVHVDGVQVGDDVTVGGDQLAIN